MKKISLLMCILFSAQSFAQKKIKKYVTDNVSVVRTINPDSLDFSDLEVIGNAIGDARIVMLGEQDHGDAPTFLAFESDFYALTNGWTHLDKKKDKIEDFLRDNIFSVWTKCAECDDLFYNYISKTHKTTSPIEITGFDNQIHAEYTKVNLKNFIDTTLRKLGIPFAKTKEYFPFLNFLDSSKISRDTSKYIEFINQMNMIIKEVPKELNNGYNLLLLSGIREDFKDGLAILKKEKYHKQIRDRQMAENLKWLAYQKYSNKKIIVWAHSAHILKNPDLINNTLASVGWTNMGHFFTRDSLAEKQTYLLGFSSKSGTAGRITDPRKYQIVQPIKNGFEDWMPANINYAFVDFGLFRELNPSEKEYFHMKGKWHLSNEAIWTEVFDGIFYIRDMYPCNESKVGKLN